MHSRSKAIGLCHKNRQISRSRTHKHNMSVKIVDKPASLCFESFGEAHKRPKYAVLLATPINHTPICFVHMRITLHCM
jgi:hypothetical protein